MALIKCSECGNRVSDLAKSCPNCGAPINENENTIEFTSKNLKAHSFMSNFLILIGFIVAAYIADGRLDAGLNVGYFIMLIGIIWLIVTRIRIWWHHD